MAKTKNAGLEPYLERLIYELRGQKVMLDVDLARIYGVPTKRLNEQIKRNRERFPADFAFQLTAKESAALRSQIATGSAQDAESEEGVSNRSRTILGRKMRPQVPTAAVVTCRGFSQNMARLWQPMFSTAHGQYK